MYIEIRVQRTINLGSSHMHVHAVTRVHAVTPKLVICVMYVFNVNLTDSFDDRRNLVLIDGPFIIITQTLIKPCVNEFY